MEDEVLVDRLRMENAEQFCTLVKMHLSFVLDLHTEDCEGYADRKARLLKWNIGLPFSKKGKGNQKATEGSHLTLHTISQMNILIDFLGLDDNIIQEGIFRRTGKLKRQQELKAKLVSGECLNLNDEQYSVHDCASVLKTILAELPEPLVTEAQYPAYCQVAEFRGNEERLLLAVQLLTLLLPSENRNFLRELLSLLFKISQREVSNRMSAGNLATLFTPHLMCPRRLTPETLHAHSQLLSRVVAFMIEKAESVFQVPDTLATDVRAYWEKKERRRRSPLRQLNESICDGTTVNTVFTFVDRERTAQENGSNPTELALAQLYAHIQSLPDSAMKRRLVKNFNKKNGQGTPAVRSEERNKHRRTRSLRDSIKKHLSGFSKNGKNITDITPTDDDSLEAMNTPRLPTGSKLRTPHIREPLVGRKLRKGNFTPTPVLSKSKSCEVINSAESEEIILNKTKNSESITKRISPNINQTRSLGQTPRNPVKSCRGKKNQSPVPSLVIPTKRQSPVLRSSSSQSVNGTFKRISPIMTNEEHLQRVSSLRRNKKNSLSPQQTSRNRRSVTPPLASNEEQLQRIASLRKSGKYLNTARDKKLSPGKRSSPEGFNCPKSVKRRSPDLPPPLPVTPLCAPLSVSNLRMHEHGLPCPTPTNRISYVSTPQCRRLGTLTTSTPACLLTSVERNSSMSPITRSAQRMPRAMQETMMTPRSRKPVVSLSGTDLCHLSGLDHWSPSDAGKKLILEESEGSDPLGNGSKANSSLSSTFRDYLYSRSVLTASPADLSFSSRTDDYQSCSEKTSLEDLPSLDGHMSESLLFCLDGNDPEKKNECSTHVCHETAI